ncbi:MAG TPA: hypothetical protein PKI14_04955 [Fervidobacterium sp.]|nr:hypothetical protein [Fervidobacterium sp.]HPT54050.1 hypothetical protein [Fervidobacterium sp.]HPZ17398.1 hypothetical protein [Fervidobacterium sp.]HQE48504.1 hypothetical protein [Fervidobacterium sp.]HUM42279.1 hypothetical protein [Fervidobacterium sp.]
MVVLITSIISSILAFFLTENYWYFTLIGIGIYYTLRKQSRIEGIVTLNFILIAAIGLLGKIRPWSLDGLNFVVYGTFASIIYDLFKKWYSSIPMFLLTGIGISLIGSVKYGNIGRLFGLILIPVFFREYSLEKKREKDSKKGGNDKNSLGGEEE